MVLKIARFANLFLVALFCLLLTTMVPQAARVTRQAKWPAGNDPSPTFGE